MKKRKITAMILSVLLLATSLFACGQSEQDKKFDELIGKNSSAEAPAAESASEPESDPFELSADLVLRTYISESSVDIWQDIIREFNETYPNIHIELDAEELFTDSDAYVTQTTVGLMSGEAGDILDLSFLPAQRYSASGVLKELDGFIEADPDFSGEKYYTNILDAMRCGGKLYTMPYEFMPIAIRLNRHAADALQVPYSTGEPIKVSEVLKFAAQLNGMPDYTDMPVLDMSGWAAFNFMEFSSRIDEDEKSAGLDTESFVQYLTDLKKAVYSENAGVNAYPMPDDGNLGDGFASIVGLHTAMERLMQGYEDMLDSKAVTPLMALETDAGDRVFSAGSLAITSACKNEEAAFAFIKFMLDNERKLDSENYYHSDLATVNREIHQKLLNEFLEDKEEAEAIDEWCTQLTEVVFFDRNIELQRKLNEICDQYMRGLLSAEECAKQMQERAWIYLNE